MEELQPAAEPLIESGPGVWKGAWLLFSNPHKGFDIILEKWQARDQLLMIALLSMARALSKVDLFALTLLEALGKIVLYIILGILVGWMGIWFISALTHFLNQQFKGNSDSNVVMTGIAFAWIPLLISNLLIFFTNFVYFEGLEIILGFIFIAALVYSFILMFIVNQKISGLSFLKNLGVMGILLLVFFAFGLLLFIFRNMMR